MGSVADDAAYEAAHLYFLKDEKSLALDAFNQFIKKYPLSNLVSFAYFKLGMIHFAQNEYKKSITFFEKVFEHPQTPWDIRFRSAGFAADAAQKAGLWAEAALVYQYIIEEFPAKIEKTAYLLKKGFALFQAADYLGAMDAFLLANTEPRPGDRPEILYWVAVTQYNISG